MLCFSLTDEEEMGDPTQSVSSCHVAFSTVILNNEIFGYFQTKEMLGVVDKLQDASGVAELQQYGDELVSLVRETNRTKEKDIKHSIDILKQNKLEAEKKVCGCHSSKMYPMS